MMASIPLFSLLRPFPAPRIASVRHLLRQISSASRPMQEGLIYLISDLFDPTKSLIATSEAKPTSLQPHIDPLPYHVHRTASQQLPVYLLAKRGGNLHQTRIRKIDGSIMDLRNDLQQALGLEVDHITINQLTRHIIIKVHKSLIWYRI